MSSSSSSSSATTRATPVKAVLVGCVPVQSLLLSMLVHEIGGTVDGRQVALSLWPTQSSEDRFLAYSAADVVAILCDTTDAASIRAAENQLLHEVRGVLSRTPILLVGVLPVPAASTSGSSAGQLASLITTADGREIGIRMETAGYYFLDLIGEDQSFSASFELFGELCRIGIYYREGNPVLVDSFRLNFKDICEPFRTAFFCTYYNADKTMGRDKGHLYITNASACFLHLGTVRADVKVIIPFADVTKIERSSIGFRGRTSIEFHVAQKSYSFAGFEDVDTAHKAILQLWGWFNSGESTTMLRATKTTPNPYLAR